MANSPQAYPIRRMIREHGQPLADAWMALVMEEADMLCGGKNPPHVLAMFGRMALQNFAHRSVEALTLAIRDGLNRKVYGQLTWPQIAEWLNDHENAVLNVSENEAAQHRFTGDNLGKDYMDRLQHASESDKRKIQRLSAMNEMLKAKLNIDNTK